MWQLGLRATIILILILMGLIEGTFQSDIKEDLRHNHWSLQTIFAIGD
jgi:hypothetical protein